jgi:hypothetical protein
LTLAALTIGYATSASAQATCPSNNRLEFINIGTGAVVNASTLATAAHLIVLGSLEFGLNTYNVALITNGSTGTCAPYWLSDDGNSSDAEYVPTRSMNLCMGGHSDTIFDHQLSPSCGGVDYDEMGPLIYNGFSLRTYFGAGNDHGHFGWGIDRVYGGAGSDDLLDNGGTGDYMYGETDGDDLYCSDGPTTTCSGGGAGDYIQDLGGNGGAIEGGGSSDEIWVCDQKPVDCGESAAPYSDDDEFWRQSGAMNPSTGCETIKSNYMCF